MSETQKEAAFQRRFPIVHDTDERQLAKKIAQAQCEERCVRRVASLAALGGALALAGLGYTAILSESFPFGTSETVATVLCQLALASLICLVILAAQLALSRRKLNRFKEECRQLIFRLSAAPVDEPRTATMPVSHPQAGVSEVDRAGELGQPAPVSSG